MDDAPFVPLEFANRVIRRFADNMFGADLVIEPRDFTILRLIFRKCGGSWEAFMSGNILQVILLEKVIENWGKRPGRKRRQEEG